MAFTVFFLEQAREKYRRSFHDALDCRSSLSERKKLNLKMLSIERRMSK